MQTQPASWAYTRVLADSRLKRDARVDALIDGSEGDRFVSITVPGSILSCPGDLPVKLLGKPPEGLDLSDGITLRSLMQNDINIENHFRMDQPLDGKASIGLAQHRVDEYQKLLGADNRTLLREKLLEANRLAEGYTEPWKTRLLAVSVAGGLAVMGGGLLLGFNGPLVGVAGLAATVGTGWLVGKPMADRWLQNRCASDLREGMKAPLAYWEDQVAVRTEVDRRLVWHKQDPHGEIPVPTAPIQGIEVREDALLVGGVRLKRKD